MKSTLLSLLAALLLAAGCYACHQDPAPVAEQLDAPVLTRFYAEADSVGAVVTVLGHNFSTQPQHDVVSFNGADAVAYYARRDTLRVRVPASATTGLLQLKVYDQTATSTVPFTVLTGHWYRQPDCPGGGRFDGIGFAIGMKCYVGTGTGNGFTKDFWEYDLGTRKWTRKADFAGGLRREAISFVLNGKGYVGYGTNTTTFVDAQDFYEYDPATDHWTRKADIPGYGTDNAVSLAVGGRGYVLTGGYSKQVLEYNPQTNTWATKRDFPGAARTQATGFVLGAKAYLGGGNPGNGAGTRDFWEYDPALDQWTRKADLLADCEEGIGFDVNGKGYLGVGYNPGRQLDEYDPARDQWTRKTYNPGPGWFGAVAFSAGGRGYVAMGLGFGNYLSPQLWAYVP